MRYLVDTNVISELGRRKPDRQVIAFLQGRDILISCIVIAELTFGARSLADSHAGKFGYIALIERLKAEYSEAIIPISLNISETSGVLRASERQQGRILEMADALIAATAIQTGATLVTRNTKDFARLGIPLFNPFGETQSLDRA